MPKQNFQNFGRFTFDMNLLWERYPWLSIAFAEYGVKEIPGPADSKRILEYHAATNLKATDDAVPWCAAFASWVLVKAGIASPRTARARDFLKWSTPDVGDNFGCIVVLKRGKNPAQGHVGFLVHSLQNGPVWVLGGNQQDAVNIQKFPRNQVIGMRSVIHPRAHELDDDIPF